jgi:serine protease AprX
MIIKRHCLLIITVLISITASAQYPAPYRYFIQFTDKNNNGYNLNNPSAFLTPRAIQRRINQNIPYDFHDLPITDAYVQSVASFGDTILNRSKWFNGVSIWTSDTNVLNQVLALPFVVGATPIGKIKKPVNNLDKSIPDPYGFIQKESMLQVHNDYAPRTASILDSNTLNYGYAYNQIHMIEGDYLHNLGYLGDGIQIAILDAGFLHADTLSGFDSLRNNHQILGTQDFVSDPLVLQNVYEDHYHGCMVLSCMGGNFPGTMVGTAPHASFWLIVTEDVYTENIVEEYNWDRGAEFSDSVGADIISTSLGYTQFDSSTFISTENQTYADMNGRTTPAAIAASIAAEKGILVCAAAGNDGQSSWHFIGTPADADSILAVGATSNTGVYAGFSSKGPSSDGVKPDVADQGLGTTVIDPTNSTGSLNIYASGTSFATPILAGAAACLWEANPNKTNMQIRQAIIESASQYNNPDTLLGYGIPNFSKALYLLNNIPPNSPDNLVSAYPNPFSQDLSFNFLSGTQQVISITLTDALGRIIYTASYSVTGEKYFTFQIPVSSIISKGVYILQLRSQSSLFSRKIIKI